MAGVNGGSMRSCARSSSKRPVLLFYSEYREVGINPRTSERSRSFRHVRDPSVMLRYGEA